MADVLTADQVIAATAATRVGAVVLARHGEPDLSRKTRLTAEGYRQWWDLYETKGLRGGQAAPDCLKAIAEKAGAVIASTRPRSQAGRRSTCASASCSSASPARI